jgi:hypothetical protein
MNDLLDKLNRPRSVYEKIAAQLFRLRCDVQRRGRAMSDEDVLAEVQAIAISAGRSDLDTARIREKSLEFFHAPSTMPTAERIAGIRHELGII